MQFRGICYLFFIFSAIIYEHSISMEKEQYLKEINKVGITTIVFNILLSIVKVVGGILAASSSLISDGIHSASDVFSTIVVLIGAKISKKAPDKKHPFGHERFESIGSIVLAFILCATAIVLGYTGIKSIIAYTNGTVVLREVDFLTYLALGFAILSILVKGWMFIYTYRVAKRINSSILKADAFHHLTDSLSSFGSLLGIIGLIIGGMWSILDPIACIIIALFILKVGFDIAISAVNQVVDKAAPEEFENEVRKVISSFNEIVRVNSLKTRMFGNMYYIEIEIAVDDNLTVKEGHEIAQRLHDKIESEFKDIKHCMIHIDPASENSEQ